MSAKGLEVIDHTVQLTHEWINELTGRASWASHRDALRLLRVTISAIRDHLPHDEAVQFAAQMPLLIRGMYFEGWRPSCTPLPERDAEGFRARIESEVGSVAEYAGPEDISEVFRVLNGRISAGEIAQVRAALPKPIRDLWPAP
ncbi:DUF2267 domain-containing protein [Defluviimonas sp. WL0002]|uniref:DUF2267 domain-containing protein n=1 Tax=Albidovulum marisflavi TaxID=2984159 RepID=A0ABT2ZBD1_9RHOB|nr:DUF2267 domain-containing protein [Defluviimonas sp. WL0002]MCV2868404.1 DUF2267 domain-containing protein [Defluviimonas sp. WL0002]